MILDFIQIESINHVLDAKVPEIASKGFRPFSPLKRGSSYTDGFMTVSYDGAVEEYGSVFAEVPRRRLNAREAVHEAHSLCSHRTQSMWIAISTDPKPSIRFHGHISLVHLSEIAT